MGLPSRGIPPKPPLAKGGATGAPPFLRGVWGDPPQLLLTAPGMQGSVVLYSDWSEMMSAEKVFTAGRNWQSEAFQLLIKADYAKAADIYQQAIAAEPDVKDYYWYLGLTLLLQGQEAEAQTTWMLSMIEGSEDQVDQWTAELMQVLRSEAERRQALEDYPVAWTIRQHMREINPGDINNLLQIVQLSIDLEKFTADELTSLGIIEILQSGSDLDPDLLLQVLQKVLDCPPPLPSLLEFAEACLPYAHKQGNLIYVLMLAATKIAYTNGQPEPAIVLAKLCLRLEAENLQVLSHLTSFYNQNNQYDESVKTAKLCCQVARTLPEQVFAYNRLLRELLATGGRWSEAFSVLKDCESLLLSLIESKPLLVDRTATSRIVNSTYVLPAMRDEAKVNRSLQNQVLQIYQASIEVYAKDIVERYRQGLFIKKKGGTVDRRLKIGYLSHCLGRHSVGWLARWIFKHHDRENFEINGYFVNYKFHVNDHIRDGFVEHVDKARKMKINCEEIAEQIYQDEIDILIDLDSITLDISCEVMALKPAPVQVTWLGWDASGIPTIDYFIADPYVVPSSAQDYYAETIWRLPQTYIAVDGFEVGVPTLRRDALDIPSDAVIYLSAQKGHKRHPATIGLQMRIIKEVPNSYFLIKGFADRESVKSFFIQMAEAEGIDRSRLRFLPAVDLESVHRANLGIADVVLDTYPYNGATTTLETLWMCVPLVTRVGQQFSARNSYTMMINAGITEGIAWTDEEYVEWGVRLGKDPVLRQQISWRLRQSRQTAPLWNAQQFTREMENAYQQMWQRYVESGK